MNTFFMGGGKYACLLHSMFSDRIKVPGYFDDVSPDSLLKERYLVKYRGGSDKAPSLLPDCDNMMIAIGSEGDVSQRRKYFSLFKSAGFKFPVLVHPSAYVAPMSSVGDGTVIQYNAIVHPHVRIGENCVISTSAIVGHDSVLGDNVYIGPGVIINGSVTIGDDTFLGTGSIVIQKKTIGKACKIAAAACVIADVPDYSLAAGVPAKIRPLTPTA